MKNHYHFIGIGGIGMGAIASLLLSKGLKVSGSDIKENQMIEQLRSQGARITIGHEASSIDGADCVVYSSAVKKNNPEFVAAQDTHIQICQRAELLAQLMQGYFQITVAGAHGKTTTSSMVSHLLMEAKLEPTTAVGGIVHALDSNAKLGEGEYFVAEVDESDGSFLNFSPDISVITNIDCEHLDYYGNFENICNAYKTFIDQTNPKGTIIACCDNQHLFDLLADSQASYLSYGFSPTNQLQAIKIEHDQFESRFDCLYQDNFIGSVTLNIPGRHNVLNALATVAVGLCLNIDFETIAQSLKGFEGVQRRFQVIGSFDDVTVIDDYAHHPTELKATLQAAKALKARRIVSVFQPHRYSRMKALWNDFLECFDDSDHIIVTDIYAASESPLEGVSSEQLVKDLHQKLSKPVHYVSKDKLITHVAKNICEGDCVMMLGAGDITRVGKELVQVLGQTRFVKTQMIGEKV